MILMKKFIFVIVFMICSCSHAKQQSVTSGGKPLYIQLYSIHGLIRSKNLELGHDADTGGQTKYVLELCKALSRNPQVARVELVTRWISDESISSDYSKPTELVNDKFSIIRIRCGGPRYIHKETLWQHLQEFVDNSIKYILSTGQFPDIVHGHYADAGFVCSAVKRLLGIPLIFTGHSLGLPKLEWLQRSGLTRAQIEDRYNIQRRIDAEEMVLLYADLVITSSTDEKIQQYRGYKYKNVTPYAVIPPGLELQKFYPYYHLKQSNTLHPHLQAMIHQKLQQFYVNAGRPLVLVLCRPDQKKNIGGLISAYGQDQELQRMANLAIFAGNREDILMMPDNERQVLTEILLLMDKYDLYGKMAIPKYHDVEFEVPELYRLAAEMRSVFVNPAFTENFGITLLEAAASGLPIVSTNHGGPQDIIANLQCGTLVDVHDIHNMTKAIKDILRDKELWHKYSNNGINKISQHYSWSVHVDNYLREVSKVVNQTKVFEGSCTVNKWNIRNIQGEEKKKESF